MSGFDKKKQYTRDDEGPYFCIYVIFNVVVFSEFVQ